MYEPIIQLTGNLGGDPTLRTTPNGTSVLDFRMATTQRKKLGEEWQDGETLWFDVTCWKQLAENVAESLRKGDRVTVTGRLAQSSYTKEDGTVSSKLVIDALAVGADLSRYAVAIKRVTRESAGERAFAHAHTGTGEITAQPVEGSVPFADEDAERDEVAA